jgi:hypothetical protein
MYEPWKIELKKMAEQLQLKEESLEKLKEENEMLKKQKVFLQSKCREKRNDVR